MRTKLFLLALYVVLPLRLAAGLFGNDCCDNYSENCCGKYAVQLRGTAFLPTNHHTRDRFDDVFGGLQVEGSYRLYDNLVLCNDRLLVWGNVSWVTASGKDSHDGIFHSHHKNRANLVPLSMGLEMEFDVCNDFIAYVGGGFSYSYLSVRDREHDDTLGVSSHHDYHRWRFGGVTKAGLRYNFCDCWFADVFADYYFTTFKRHDSGCTRTSHGNFNGVFLGAGVGMKF